MKRIIFTLGLVFLFALSGQAQEISENAIGLRFGGGNGFGAEISYQRHLNGANNRLEGDLGFRNNSDFNSFKITGLYQWVWNIEGNFNWYAGVGGGFGNVNDRRPVGRHHHDGAFLFIAGDIGVEYVFDIPLQVFLDFRPEINLVNYNVYNSFGPDLAIGIRYQF